MSWPFPLPVWRPPVLFLGTLLSTLVLTSCASMQQETAIAPQAPEPMAEAPAAVEQSKLAGTDALPPAEAANLDVAEAAPAPRSRPQLIRNASMTLRVEKVDAALKQVLQLLRRQQGDLLGLEDQTPPDESIRHTVALRLRVPQERLEPILDDLAALGTVQARSLTAEDVSNQLVDLQARLRNLRKAETTVLGIMDRSGSIKEVLEVSRELANIRQSIEQIDAQLSRLQNQVAYSEISLILEAAIATAPTEPSFGQQMQEAWERSTHSVAVLTTNLLQLGIWLLAYSPYLALVAIAATLGYRRIGRRTTSAAAEPESPPANS